MLREEVGEEENLEHSEDDDQLDDDDRPQRAPDFHVPETVGI